MSLRKPAGRSSPARKYDILTVLGSFALSQDPALQRLTLRLICLITARYNWQANQLSVAQTEIAKLWSCDPRTVKREMAKLRQRGWLVEQRAPARGRASVYGLGSEQIFEDTRPVWQNIGPDLVDRLQPEPTSEPATSVIPFPQAPGPVSDGSLWAEIGLRLHAEDPAIYRAWFAGLTAELREEALCLQAPGGFHARYIDTHLRPRLERALADAAPGLRLQIS